MPAVLLFLIHTHKQSRALSARTPAAAGGLPAEHVLSDEQGGAGTPIYLLAHYLVVAVWLGAHCIVTGHARQQWQPGSSRWRRCFGEMAARCDTRQVVENLRAHLVLRRSTGEHGDASAVEVGVRWRRSSSRLQQARPFPTLRCSFVLPARAPREHHQEGPRTLVHGWRIQEV